ncbi:hypothetical protein B0T11DRAFT_232952 [Plectosphaerella cucumerina]|uniref:Uncharacterized protein n=1 Tax=Plectosphaerella cucumerina TaxID=40658 RepID=A0A8K0WZV4_9PEZI|nr:hypothetical protein B0T11DRAFT_232952 [Plectosphaerella cucumerina]
MASPPQSPPSGVASVAVIGAGISGVCSAAYALREGLSVTVFDRSTIAGGVWHYDERKAEEPPYPNEKPSEGDYRLSQPGERRYPTPPPGDAETKTAPPSDTDRIRFSPPGPCYAGLMNNVPTRLMSSNLGAWPEGTPDFTSQSNLEAYVQQLARDTGVNGVTRFGTRVDGVKKSPDGTRWHVRTVRLDEATGALQDEDWTFDAVVVATGHYNMPRVPDIPGLAAWKAAFPDRVTHSKRYRTPDTYRDKNLFIIGGGVSSVDICRELDGKAKKVYQSTRLGKYDLPTILLPSNTERVAGVARFELDETTSPSGPDDHLPGRIILTDGRVIDDIDNVVLGTGYITSYPFLQDLHSDTATQEEAGDRLLVTREGDMTHNLHRDIWYIEDPTLSFVGAPYHVSTFSLFSFQAQAVSRVLAGKARLPPREERRRLYRERVAERGLGRDFHSLRAHGAEVEYLDSLNAWLDADAKELGHAPIEGISEAWRAGYWEFKQAMKNRLGVEL